MARQDMVWQEKTKTNDNIRHAMGRQDKTKHGKSRPGKTGQDKIRHDIARQELIKKHDRSRPDKT